MAQLRLHLSSMIDGKPFAKERGRPLWIALELGDRLSWVSEDVLSRNAVDDQLARLDAKGKTSPELLLKTHDAVEAFRIIMPQLEAAERALGSIAVFEPEVIKLRSCAAVEIGKNLSFSS